ncbi:MAG: hypothetical protein JW893_09325 [Candidatus Omnitrophica bacterium]|nr:hypothetical protein [Candidatus Omnitrophota bacterium]
MKTKQKNENNESSRFPDYHELKTPLATIQSVVDILVDGLEDERLGKDQQREYLSIIVKNCRRLEELFDNIQAEIKKKDLVDN